MIAEIFPEGFQRYQALPVLGPLMDRMPSGCANSSTRGAQPDTSCAWPDRLQSI
jgi:hypothetical protein